MVVDRRVRRVRLRGTDHEEVRRGALLLEDALRTASLAGTDGSRLYFVRRLALPAIDPTLPPATLALSIERRFAALRPLAVHGNDGAASAAEVVYFDDEVQSLVLFIERLVAGRAMHAWYWPLVVPGFERERSVARALDLALTRSFTFRAAAAGIVRMMAELRASAVDALCAALSPSHGVRLLAHCGFVSHGGRAAALQTVQRDPVRASASWIPLIAKWVRQWGADDARSTWLASVALCAERPSCCSDPTIGVEGARLALRLALVATAEERMPAAVRGERETPPDHLERAVIDLRAPTMNEARSEESRRGGVELSRLRRSASPVHPEHADTPANLNAAVGQRSGTDARERSALDDSEPYAAGSSGSKDERLRNIIDSENINAEEQAATLLGGLLFVVRPLLRLGFAEWLREHPRLLRAGFATELLVDIAASLRRSADPLLTALDPFEPAPSLHARAPSAWSRTLGPRTAAALEARQAGSVRTWRLAVSLLLRQSARLRLATLVRRPARFLATRTHLDVFFRLSAVDMRVRGAALDCDPGWVPWLGRVVHFHYCECEP